MTHFELATDKPPTYPSEWFKNNPEHKPPMEVHVVEPNRRGNLHSTVRLQYGAGTLSPAVATAISGTSYPVKVSLFQKTGHHSD